MKADDKVEYEGLDSPEKYTNFEELQKRVEILQENYDEIVEILKYNNLDRKKTIEADYFDEDEVYKKLEEDKE